MFNNFIKNQIKSNNLSTNNQIAIETIFNNLMLFNFCNQIDFEQYKIENQFNKFDSEIIENTVYLFDIKTKIPDIDFQFDINFDNNCQHLINFKLNKQFDTIICNQIFANFVKQNNLIVKINNQNCKLIVFDLTKQFDYLIIHLYSTIIDCYLNDETTNIIFNNNQLFFDFDCKNKQKFELLNILKQHIKQNKKYLKNKQ